MDYSLVLHGVNLALHALASTVWVGGLFFALVVLRPAANPLEAPQRLQLQQRVFSGFFPWVWASIAVILLTGFAMIYGFYGGMANIGLYVHLMLGLGILMVLLFFHIYFAPYRRFKRALAAQDWSGAGVQGGKVRLFMIINLTLGVVVVILGAGGQFLLP
ncbi:MAG: CopD family protein [Candidatus Competibacterales bacterium]